MGYYENQKKAFIKIDEKLKNILLGKMISFKIQTFILDITEKIPVSGKCVSNRIDQLIEDRYHRLTIIDNEVTLKPEVVINEW